MRTLTIAFIALLLCPGPALAETPTVLFRWSDDRCARWDIPDAPARAWRDAAGRIRLLAAAEVARTSVGPDLLTLRRDCVVRFEGRGDADPSSQDDRIWIASVLARGGHQIDAIGHAEFHGHNHPGACHAGDYMSCWRNALVALQSRDGGESFQRMPAPPIARLPYRYDPAQRGRSGYFNPSNMIERAGLVYVYFFAEAYKAQQRGVCVARRPVGGAPDSWYFWDGVGFNGRFADPYAAVVLHPEQHVCTPLPGLSATLSSVVLQPEIGRYLAVSPGVGRDADGTRRTGIWALQSADLLHWTDAVLLADLPLLWARNCDNGYAYAYPSLIDPSSQDQNFSTVDNEFWLTIVRMNLDDRCRTGPERDLVAVGVSWRGTAGALPILQARPRGWPDPAR